MMYRLSSYRSRAQSSELHAWRLRGTATWSWQWLVRGSKWGTAQDTGRCVNALELFLP